MLLPLLILLTILAPQAPPTASAEAITQLTSEDAGQGRYRLTFALAPDVRVVRIYASASPDRFDRGAMVAESRTSPIIITAPNGRGRVYFHVVPDRGARRVTALRRLPLEGAKNFRDLGGYRTTDGQYVRWGRVFRSGALAKLTANDYARLSELGIQVVCDLRSDPERGTAPTVWQGSEPPRFVLLPTLPRVESLPTGGSALDRFAAIYRSFALDGPDGFAGALAAIGDDGAPVLVHCSAGKDRTGLFSAMLLLALGVPRDAVMQDYIASTTYLRDDPDYVSRAAAASESDRVQLETNPALLDAALSAIDERHGTFDRYRRERLGVSDARLAQIRQLLLEP
jgi:protein-tyrosine phosphatase